MNPIAKEILSFLGIATSLNPVAEDILMHYGTPRRSGRYPYGSGDNPYQHNTDFLGRVEELRKQDFSYTDENGKTWTGDTAIAKSMGLSTNEFRKELSWAKDERRMLTIARIKSLREDGLGWTEIGRQLDMNESSVRSLLDERAEARTNQAKETADFIRSQIDSKGMIDVGKGVERELNISAEKLNEALHILEKEGYPVYGGRIPQATNPGQHTTQKIICPPGTPHKAIYEYDKIHPLNEDDYISRDDGKTFSQFVYPKSMDSKRLMVRYAEDGGIDKDGIIELRRGVDDLSLGNSHYSQVRILVDDTKYIKGMAVYSDDMPDGVDVIFNTNKSKSIPKMECLKNIKNDPDNPFGSLIKAGGQSTYFDKDGNEQLSLINKCRNEGDWSEWKDALPSQFLGKQSYYMAKKQLNLAKADKLAEYDEICSLENPTIKKHLLQKFSDECDSAAVHLQAAALPGQKYHVIIPVNTLKDNEIYAPNYTNGSKVALIRYPHGGTFEIPILTVNNKHTSARDLIGTETRDAVGINKKIADRLSGADFDGDTVMVIPTHDKEGKVKITSTQYFKELEGFDPKMAYPEREGMKIMKDTQKQMGVISNLITDMTLAGATEGELARAVKHSMVVIDAEKHHLDYKQSEIDNNISALKKEYQSGGGASTILSRAKGQTSVDKRQGTPTINIKGTDKYDPSKPEGAYIYKTSDDILKPVYTTNKKTGVRTYTTITGEKIKYDPENKEEADKYRPIKRKNKDTGEITYTNKAGDITYLLENKKQKSTNMAETDDAYSLVSENKYQMEMIYAEYANSMKALANQARKEMVSTGKIAYSSEAKDKYKPEVASLNSKLKNAEINKPREREAQRRAYVEVDAKIQAAKAAGEKMKPGDIKKANQQAIEKARNEVGSVKRRDRNIEITDREWEAIQAGAISENTLKKILDNTDTAKLRERATPRATTVLSEAQVNRAKAMSASSYTINEIAKKLGVSTSAVSKALKGED